MKDTGLEHEGCDGRFKYQDPGDTGDIVCSKCTLHTGLENQFLGCCGCGIPTDVARWVMRILDKLQERSAGSLAGAGPAVWAARSEELDALLGTPDEARYFILYQLDHLGLTEHGGNVTGCWLTEKGKAVLQAFKGKPWWEDDEAA